MDIQEYRAIADRELFSHLKPLGFEQIGDNFFRSKNGICFALLRIKDKRSNISKQFRYLCVVRHEFLPNLEDKAIEGFTESASDYPFKINPLKISSLKKGIFKKNIIYKYTSCNLGHYDTANINYDSEDPINTLRKILNEIRSSGIEWSEILTPDVGAQQIHQYGNNEYIEKIWLKSYRAQGYLG